MRRGGGRIGREGTRRRGDEESGGEGMRRGEGG